MDFHTSSWFLNQLPALDKHKARTVLFKLGVIRRVGAPVYPGQVSIARLWTIMAAFGVCVRLRKRYTGVGFWEPARLFCTMETCCHALYALFTLACLSEWNQVQESESFFFAERTLELFSGTHSWTCVLRQSCNASVPNGAWQSESRETSGSNINKKKSCSCSFKLSYRQKEEIL